MHNDGILLIVNELACMLRRQRVKGFVYSQRKAPVDGIFLFIITHNKNIKLSK